MELVFAGGAGPPTLFPKSIKILEFRVLEYGICVQLSLFWYAGNLTWVTGVGMRESLVVVSGNGTKCNYRKSHSGKSPSVFAWS
jgi:hypothetical protein